MCVNYYKVEFIVYLKFQPQNIAKVQHLHFQSLALNVLNITLKLTVNAYIYFYDSYIKCTSLYKIYI